MNRLSIPSKLYSQLKPAARLRAMQEAHKRKDSAEVSRLLDSAPEPDSEDTKQEPRTGQEVAGFAAEVVSGVVRAMIEGKTEPEDLEGAKESLGQVLASFTEGEPVSKLPGLADPEGAGFQFARIARIRREVKASQAR